jgi:DHA2 family multidrug resistance protein
MGVVVAPIIGPTLGGWITDNFSWRWIFFINIPIGVLSILMSSALVRDPSYLVRKTFKTGLRIDFIGLSLLTVGLGFTQIALDKGERDDWFGSHFIVWCVVIAVCGIVGLIIWELRQKDPIIDLRLLKDRNFAVATMTMFALGVVLYGTTVLLPVMVQTLMGYTAELSGLVLSPGAIITMLSMPLVGRLLSKYEARWLVVFGLLVLATGMFRLSGLDLETNFATFVYTWMISRGGLGFLFVPINVMAFNFIPREKTNNASGLINLARNVGGSIGISAVTTMQSRLSQKHQGMLVEHMSPFNPKYQQALDGLAATLQAGGANAAQALEQARAMLYQELVRQSEMLAYVDVFWLLGATCLAMIPMMFLMKRSRAQKGPVAAH